MKACTEVLLTVVCVIARGVVRLGLGSELSVRDVVLASGSVRE